MKKSLLKGLLLLTASLTLVGCGDNSEESSSSSITTEPTTPTTTDTSIEEEKVLKKAHGSGALFAEYEGFMANDASIIEEDNVRYVAYVSNEEENNTETAIYVRKGTKDENGKYVYGERKLAIKGGVWDKKVTAPSIIKGEFKLGDETYSYLMAYQGNASDDNTNNNIGFAYAKDIMGEWKKVGEVASVTYSTDIHGKNIYGMGSPELINLDKKGSLGLFYTWGESTLTCTAVKKLNASDLNAITIKGDYQITVKGLKDGGDNPIFANAGFALSNDGSKLFTARDIYPLSSVAPGHSNKIEVASASSSIVDNIELSWNSESVILGSDTIVLDDPDSRGWDEIYSASFVKDGFGYLLNDDSVEVVYSGMDEKDSYESDYRFSSFVCSMNVSLTK